MKNTTTDRWRAIASELLRLAQAVEGDELEQADAEQRVGVLACREALALRASTPLESSRVLLGRGAVRGHL